MRASEHPYLQTVPEGERLVRDLPEGDELVCGALPGPQPAGAYQIPPGLQPCHLHQHAGPWHQSAVMPGPHSQVLPQMWRWHGVRKLGHLVVQP